MDRRRVWLVRDILIVWVTVTCYMSVVLSQTGPELQVENISSIHGKYFSNLQDIIEDESGYIWLATGEGLLRFDGYQFVPYSHDIDDSTSLAHPNVRVLSIDSSGHLRAGTTFGICTFEPATGRFKRDLVSPQNKYSKVANNVTELSTDADGRLWCRSAAGVFYRNPGDEEFTLFDIDNTPLRGSPIRDFHLGGNGRFYCGTPRGLFSIHKEDDGSILVEKVEGMDVGIRAISGNGSGAVVFATDQGLWEEI